MRRAPLPAILVCVPRDLTAAWIPLAVLYFAAPRGLPEPMVALLVGTTVGLASGLLKAAVDGRRPNEADPARPVPAGTTVCSSAPPDAPAGAPLGAPAGSPAAHPAARPPAAPFPARPLRLDGYPGRDPSETQCPHCGSWTTAGFGDGSGAVRCPTCRHTWRADDPASTPDVVVRSWLSTTDHPAAEGDEHDVRPEH
jgi:hypothetical protein